MDEKELYGWLALYFFFGMFFGALLAFVLFP